VTDATIVIPTHRHAALLPVALRSALGQQGGSIEVFVVGDGVEDDTRGAVEPFLADSRVRFFDFPKGERHGERNRHEALQDAGGEIICYLSDDDLLLPGHFEEMRRLLENADFAHSAPVGVLPGGELSYGPADLARPEFLSLLVEGRNNFIGLTGAAHTRSTYERLPHGWRPAPASEKTDLHMWQQIIALPGFRGATGTHITALHFPDPWWRGVEPALRAAELEAWLARALLPGAEAELKELLELAVLRAAQDFKLRSIERKAALRRATEELERLRLPRWRRALRRALRFRLVRALRSRLR
jgi:glycosyltransferase involved in cell wall biosynthesis